jgi:3,4-dihydroxy 2-butanone 4-phosphate synthase/GTP cyclohydrolase II
MTRSIQESFATVETAIERIRSGRMVLLVDDEDRENEGDLVFAAQFATPENVNFMAKHGRGLICLAMDGALLDKLELPMMTDKNQAPYGTAFTVSIEARKGVTTGISAHDRAHTIQTAIRDNVTRDDLVVPGHIFPLRAREGGVLVRTGQTEGSVDLARLAGLKPAGVICEVLKDDGTMARRPELEIMAKEFDIPVVSVADLVLYRLHNDASLVKEVARSKLPSRFGDFDLVVFESGPDKREDVALVLGDPASFKERSVLVRVHSECLTGDVFGSLRCDCGSQLDAALKQIGEAGEGVLLYLRQEGRGIGLRNKIKAYELQDGGLDTVEANAALGFAPDLRQYGLGAQILRSLGVRTMKLLSNNPKKLVGLEGFGLEVTERVPLMVGRNPSNERYLETKKTRLGHLFP